MITRSLTTRSASGPVTVAGQAPDEHAARRSVIAATRTAVERTDTQLRPRYVLHVGGRLVALIDTGLDVVGQPDHTEVKRLTGTASTTQNNVAVHL